MSTAEQLAPDVLAIAFREIRGEIDRLRLRGDRLEAQRDALGAECLELRARDQGEIEAVGRVQAMRDEGTPRPRVPRDGGEAVSSIFGVIACLAAIMLGRWIGREVRR